MLYIIEDKKRNNEVTMHSFISAVHSYFDLAARTKSANLGHPKSRSHASAKESVFQSMPRPPVTSAHLYKTTLAQSPSFLFDNCALISRLTSKNGVTTIGIEVDANGTLRNWRKKKPPS